ncbi:MAG: hypothetical protein JWO34_1716, partial [Arthrobacter sp.]|nr:hypothetical protein [Arthrobacter sp.]
MAVLRWTCPPLAPSAGHGAILPTRRPETWACPSGQGAVPQSCPAAAPAPAPEPERPEPHFLV